MRQTEGMVSEHCFESPAYGSLDVVLGVALRRDRRALIAQPFARDGEAPVAMGQRCAVSPKHNAYRRNTHEIFGASVTS